MNTSRRQPRTCPLPVVNPSARPERRLGAGFAVTTGPVARYGRHVAALLPLLTLLCAGAARAGEAATASPLKENVATATPSSVPSGPLARVSDGDAAWWTGDRGTAARAWRLALAEAQAAPRSPEAWAAEAMARLRLLHVGGSIAPFVHERALYRALDSCPVGEPWCDLAAADAELWLPTFIGADPAQVPVLLRGSPLAGPAAARIAVATEDRTALDALDDEALDGMGRGIRAGGRLRAEEPGTWSLNVGAGGAPGAGFAVFGRFAHPDLAWRGHLLDVTGSVDTLGGYLAAGTVRTATDVPLTVALSASRARAWTWNADVPTPYGVTGARAAAAAGLRLGGRGAADAEQAPDAATADPLAAPVATAGLSLGLAGRIERFEGVGLDGLPAGVPIDAATAGPTATLVLGELWTGTGVRVAIDSAFGGYTHLSTTLDLRAHPHIGRATVALRVLGTVVPTGRDGDPDAILPPAFGAGSPFHRLPTLGGSETLRGQSAGRYRDVLVGVAQIEARHPIVGPLHGAVFWDGGWAEGAHWTAGGGLRLALPTAPQAATRLDVGAWPGGWGVVAGIGEAF
jgi:hypothetical protein